MEKRGKASLTALESLLYNGLGVRFGRPVPLKGLDNQAHFDGLGRNVDATHLAINDGADTLHVGLEGPFVAAGNTFTDTAEVFGTTAVVLVTASGGLFSCKWAYARHKSVLSARVFHVGEGLYPQGRSLQAFFSFLRRRELKVKFRKDSDLPVSASDGTMLPMQSFEPDSKGYDGQRIRNHHATI
jgi:hypothetical protein